MHGLWDQRVQLTWPFGYMQISLSGDHALGQSLHRAYESSDKEGLLQGHIYRVSRCIRLAKNGATCNDAAINLR